MPFTFDCVSTQMGNLQVTAQDEFTLVSPGAPNVSNATVTVTDFLTGSQRGQRRHGIVGHRGFLQSDLGLLQHQRQASNHGGFGTTVLVPANQTTNVTAFLPVNLVSYSWVVTPTEIPDDYEFTLTTTFQTQVPWPVVTINPGAINLCGMSGTNQIDLVITNNGLISAQGLVLSFGSNRELVYCAPGQQSGRSGRGEQPGGAGDHHAVRLEHRCGLQHCRRAELACVHPHPEQLLYDAHFCL